MGRTFGDNSTDYERYVRAHELYGLVKDHDAWANEDEPLFQVTHMSMELWLAVVVQHLDQATIWIGEKRARPAARFLRRSAAIMAMLETSLHLLESMTPWNYHGIRVGLGRGSGQQSPTFTHLLTLGPAVFSAYKALLSERGIDVDSIQRDPQTHDELYELTDAMMEYDSSFMRWRYVHFQLVKRVIGDAVLSLKGVPAAALSKGAEDAQFPELWAAINRTTHAYGELHGTPGLSGAYTVLKPDEREGAC